MPDVTVLTDRFDRVLLYATHVHGGQSRKGTSVPVGQRWAVATVRSASGRRRWSTLADGGTALTCIPTTGARRSREAAQFRAARLEGSRPGVPRSSTRPT